MKKILYLLTFFFCSITYSQSGFYGGFNFQGGSNFVGKQDKAMHHFGAEFSLGYQFNKYFQAGAFIPFTYSIFRENNQRYSGMFNEIGIEINTLLYKKENFGFRLEATTSIIDTKKQEETFERKQNWIFSKSSLALLFCEYFDDFDYFYVGIGLNYYTDTHKYSPTHSKSYHFFAPFICLGSNDKIFKNKKRK